MHYFRKLWTKTFFQSWSKRSGLETLLWAKVVIDDVHQNREWRNNFPKRRLNRGKSFTKFFIPTVVNGLWATTSHKQAFYYLEPIPCRALFVKDWNTPSIFEDEKQIECLVVDYMHDTARVTKMLKFLNFLEKGCIEHFNHRSRCCFSSASWVCICYHLWFGLPFHF